MRQQIISLARAAMQRESLEAAGGVGVLSGLIDEVAARRRDPRSAAGALLKAVRAGWGNSDGA